MAKKKNTETNDVTAKLEDIHTALLSLESKVANISHVCSMTEFMLQRQYEKDLMHYDAYIALYGNNKLIKEQYLMDEIEDIYATLDAVFSIFIPRKEV